MTLKVNFTVFQEPGPLNPPFNHELMDVSVCNCVLLID